VIIHPPLGTARYRFVAKIGAWIDTEQYPMAYILLHALVTNWVRALPAKLQFILPYIYKIARKIDRRGFPAVL
jgi:hypothetical protein